MSDAPLNAPDSPEPPQARSLDGMDGRIYAEGPPRTLAEIFGIWFTPPHIVAALRPPAPPSLILCNPPFGHSPIDQDQVRAESARRLQP